MDDMNFVLASDDLHLDNQASDDLDLDAAASEELDLDTAASEELDLDVSASDDRDLDVQSSDNQDSAGEVANDQATYDQAAADLNSNDLASNDFASVDQVTTDSENDTFVDDKQDDSNLFTSVWESVTDFVSPFIDTSNSDLPLHDEYELVDIETFALSPIVSSSGLKGVLLDVIGPYDNIITQYRYQANSSSSYSYVHETSPDYPWIFSAILFICLLLSLFSLVKRFFTWMK